MKNIYTSSGIIKNADKPRVGIISQHSVDSDLLDEILRCGINLSWDTFINDLRNDLTKEGKSEDEIEEELNNANDNYQNDNDIFLYGDWEEVESGKDKGKYQINKQGKHGFALTFSGNNLCVEWSTITKLCHHTSPCYVMSNGDGPCGDLDTQGNSVLAYALPIDCLLVKE
jgi:hypothetical protein